MEEYQYGLPKFHHCGVVLLGGEDANGGGQTTEELQALQEHGNQQPQTGPFFSYLKDSCGYEQGRWPRQETLTLLEIRSRLDPKFKESAHKASLWNDVSRIMAEEYGYQRSGRKCREKLENLYKYYKKTKKGKAGRLDGKHYRFFRQLEALYGASSSNLSTAENAMISPYMSIFHRTTKIQSINEDLHLENSVGLAKSEELYTSSSEDDEDGSNDLCNDDMEHQQMKKDNGGILRRKSWRSKIKETVEMQLRRFMEMQEAWLEKMLNTLEHKEQERMNREEEWRMNESARLERERMILSKERVCIEARDIALIEALEKISSRWMISKLPMPETQSSVDVMESSIGNNKVHGSSRRWPEHEITTLIQHRTTMEGRFREGGCPKIALWEEISAGMVAVGYDRSSKRCKEKWENINKYFRKTKECNKKRRDNSKTCPYYKHLDALYSHGRQEPSLSSSDIVVDGRSKTCFRLLMDGGCLWEDHATIINADKEVEIQEHHATH